MRLPSCSPRTPAVVGLILITALGWLARASGLGALLPHHPEPDAHVVEQAQRLQARHVTGETRDAIQGKYPLLLADLVVATSHPLEPPPIDAPLEAHLAAASAPYIAVRRVVAASGALLAPLVYLLARQWGASSTALWAAAFAASSLLSVALSVQARPHAPTWTVGCLALWCACMAARRGPWPWIPLACVAGAAAFGTLQSGAATAIPIALAAWLLLRRAPSRTALALACGAALALPVLLRAYEPSAFTRRVPTSAEESRPSAQRPEEGAPRLQGHRLDPAALDGSGLGIGLRALLGHDPGLVVAACMGAWHLRRRRRQLLGDPRVWCVAAFGMAALAPWALYGRSEARLFLPAVPLLALLAGSGARVSLVARLALAVACTNVVRLAVLRAGDDTFEVASAELIDSIAGEPVLVVAHESLPLFQASGDLSIEDVLFRTLWERYQLQRGGLRTAPRPRLFYPPIQLRRLAHSGENDADCALSAWIDGFGPCAIVTGREPRLLQEATRRGVRAWLRAAPRGESARLLTFPPGGSTATYLGDDLGRLPALDLWRRNRLGPTLDLWRK